MGYLLWPRVPAFFPDFHELTTAPAGSALAGLRTRLNSASDFFIAVLADQPPCRLVPGLACRSSCGPWPSWQAPTLWPLRRLAAPVPLSVSATELNVPYTLTVTGHDTLIALGRRLLADPRQWPQLQSFNHIADPRRLPVGTALRIPLRLMPTEAVARHGGGGVG